LAATGLPDGVTTNPLLILNSVRDFIKIDNEILGIVDEPVMDEFPDPYQELMMCDFKLICKISDNIREKV
jgi:hypothetical protein